MRKIYFSNRNPIRWLSRENDSHVKKCEYVFLSVCVACCCQEVLLFFLEAETEHLEKGISAHVDARGSLLPLAPGDRLSEGEISGSLSCFQGYFLWGLKHILHDMPSPPQLKRRFLLYTQKAQRKFVKKVYPLNV
jgi:hypothetical protein